MTRKMKVKEEVENRLQKIIIYLKNEGMLTHSDMEFKVFLGKIGVIVTTCALALSVNKEDALSDLLNKFSEELIDVLDNPEELDMDMILKMMGGSNPDLN